MWAYLLESLIDPTNGELTVLQVACEAWALRQEALAAIATQGLSTLTRDGGLKSHPAAVVLKDQSGVFLRCVSALGIDSIPLDA